MSYQPIGPARVYIGDPTSGLSQLTKARNVGFDANPRTAHISTDDLGGVPHIDGIYQLADSPEVQVDLEDADLDQLENLMPKATRTDATDSVVGGNDAFEQIAAADVPTLFILPETEQADGVSAAHGLWLPGVTIQTLDGFSFGRVDEGEIDNPYNTSFQGVYRENDQGDTSIPDGNRLWFMGPPDVLGLSWSIS